VRYTSNESLVIAPHLDLPETVTIADSPRRIDGARAANSPDARFPGTLSSPRT